MQLHLLHKSERKCYHQLLVLASQLSFTSELTSYIQDKCPHLILACMASVLRAGRGRGKGVESGGEPTRACRRMLRSWLLISGLLLSVGEQHRVQKWTKAERRRVELTDVEEQGNRIVSRNGRCSGRVVLLLVDPPRRRGEGHSERAAWGEESMGHSLELLTEDVRRGSGQLHTIRLSLHQKQRASGTGSDTLTAQRSCTLLA